LSREERQDLVFRSLVWLARHSGGHGKIIVLLENTRNLAKYPGEIELRSDYNEFIRRQCAAIA